MGIYRDSADFESNIVFRLLNMNESWEVAVPLLHIHLRKIKICTHKNIACKWFMGFPCSLGGEKKMPELQETAW